MYIDGIDIKLLYAPSISDNRGLTIGMLPLPINSVYNLNICFNVLTYIEDFSHLHDEAQKKLRPLLDSKTPPCICLVLALIYELIFQQFLEIRWCEG